MNNHEKFTKTIAAFDFDGTITDRDSSIPFYFSFMNPIKVIYRLVKLTPYFLCFVLKLLPRQQIKERIISEFLGGMLLKKAQELSQIYADSKLDSYVKSEAIERLKWHRSQGHRCILISASLDLYLAPWAKRYGIDELICSKPEITEEGKITGRLIGKNCWGPEKTKRLTELLGPKENYYLYAYGDSRGDRELLELADEPFFKPFK